MVGDHGDAVESGLAPSAAVEPPALLYHYTTAAGMLGILESGELWASHARFLNDPTEIGFAAGLISEAIEARLEELETSPGDGLLGQAKKLWIYLKLQTGKNWVPLAEQMGAFYVTCFCEDRDLLSQWRGYGAGVGGFALGFRAAALASPGVRLIKVIYDVDAQLAHVRDVLDRMGDTGKGPALAEMVWMHVSLKNSAFAEEDEWRLITYRADDIDVHVRSTDERLVPYVRLRSSPTSVAEAGLSASPTIVIEEQSHEAVAGGAASLAPSDAEPEGADDVGLPLEEIVIGPTADAGLAESAARIALARNGYADSVTIHHSNIPLRKT